ncbi:hypothetical protein EFP18_29475 (plasmid) [Burkholderia glumae]|nr:hypothetical protein CEQ24_029585 [Burkholderia glumae]PNK93261.1 hypothetical protein CEQ24_030380 [Burkholderia glumae]PNL04056.1 hypothetical protein CEQ24_011855 [Burkholderia glumae]RQZ65838.1 hypothetical protein DF052_26180 [Burkholderia glumae]UVS82857.1 hypothetical protein EFP18_00900 [Burkholderia glumae]
MAQPRFVVPIVRGGWILRGEQYLNERTPKVERAPRTTLGDLSATDAALLSIDKMPKHFIECVRGELGVCQA